MKPGMLKKKWMGFCLWIGYLPWCTFRKNLYSCRRSMKINYNNSSWFGVDRIKGYKKILLICLRLYKMKKKTFQTSTKWMISNHIRNWEMFNSCKTDQQDWSHEINTMRFLHSLEIFGNVSKYATESKAGSVMIKKI